MVSDFSDRLPPAADCIDPNIIFLIWTSLTDHEFVKGHFVQFSFQPLFSN